MNSSALPEGSGSVAGAPNLPEGFAGTFTSRYVDTGDVREHVVTGGGGPPLLLVHGWPETWYAWRLVTPGLARHFSVVAPDQRGCGLSGHHRAERAAHHPAAEDTRAGDRRSGRHRRGGCEHDEAGRG
jgi:pimeloyl-ACP methyl ester carboxylesterase